MITAESKWDLERIIRWRNLAGWVGAGFFLLAFLALIDGLVGQWREPASLIKLLPGQTVEIDGPLLEEVKDSRELSYFSDSSSLRITFAAVHKGYFLGGNLWRGQITAGPQIPPGEYYLTVAPRWSTSKQATPAFRILVFPDQLSLQHSSKSVIRRYLGFSPWALAALCLPGILLSFGTVFLFSLKLTQLQAQEGKAEIYRVIRRDGDFEVHFSLGMEHGMQPGLELRVFNPRGEPVALARVEQATPKDAIAVVTTDQEIRPGFMVCLAQAGKPVPIKTFGSSDCA
ncbi:MAG: hypothetical protein M1438_18310 [Deltaproteobacteria bacterium]|nr:hypothetical protein [Deltaproteobacteria bacterium]